MAPQTPDESLSRDSLQEPLLGESSPAENDESSTPSVDNKDIVLPCCCSPEPTRINYNVFLNLVLAVLYGISNSLWNGTAYAAYLNGSAHSVAELAEKHLSRRPAPAAFLFCSVFGPTRRQSSQDWQTPSTVASASESVPARNGPR